MVEKVKQADNIESLIFALESLAYYFNIKPSEFWESTYGEINLYIQSNLGRIIDELKRNIEVQEASTNKLIMADAMSNKKPKLMSIQKMFKGLY